MKVVLFCGGMGMRMREASEALPKPLVCIGDKPILLHLMKYYAYHGHKDFVLCLGYKGEVIKDFFLNYNEKLANDFTLAHGKREVTLLNNEMQDWTISFVDTGLSSNIGMRLKAVEKYLQADEFFLANYADGLADVPLPRMIEDFHRRDKVASFVSIRPKQTFHVVESDKEGMVKSIEEMGNAGMWINGGYFVFKKEIFDYIQEGNELVNEPFQRLIAKDQLHTFQHDGFWACMDTFKEKQQFDDLYMRGHMPWAVWQR